jgi:HPt (histidine-containing phosphotransfer) domain-containing protein
LLLKSTPARLERLEAAIDARDPLAAGWEAHGLKGSFLTVGATRMATACATLKSLMEEGEFSIVDEVFDRLCDDWERLKHEAEQRLHLPGDRDPSNRLD